MKYVVVLFAYETDEPPCSLNRCPMEAIEVSSRAEGQEVAGRYEGFEPHFLTVRDAEE